MPRIQNRVAEFRERLNMTQEELAEKSKMDRTSISKIENGKDVRMSTAHRLCDALGTESNVLWPRPTNKKR